MEIFFKVADVNELPPGKGKLVHVEGRDLYVYNLEGRYFATMAAERLVSAPEAAAMTCRLPSSPVDVTVEDAPARLHEEAAEYTVSIEGDAVVLRAPSREPEAPKGRRRRRRVH